jgi:hypothetical protein
LSTYSRYEGTMEIKTGLKGRKNPCPNKSITFLSNLTLVRFVSFFFKSLIVRARPVIDT